MAGSAKEKAENLLRKTNEYQIKYTFASNIWILVCVWVCLYSVSISIFELVIKNTKKIETPDTQSRVAWWARRATTVAEAFCLAFDATLDRIHMYVLWMCWRYWVTIVVRFVRTYSMGFVDWIWKDECVGRFWPSSPSLLAFVMFVCRFVYYGPWTFAFDSFVCFFRNRCFAVCLRMIMLPI